MNRVLTVAALLALAAACSSPPKAGTLQQAHEAYLAGDFAGAAALCDAAIAAGTALPEAHLLRGKCRVKLGDLNGAAADYEQSMQLDPSQAEPALRAANARLELGSVDRARDAVETLFGGRYSSLSTRERVLAHGVYGEVLLEWPDPVNAASELEKGLELARRAGLSGDAAVGILYYNLSRAHFARANYRKARDSFVMYLQTASGDADLDRYTMVVLQFLSGDVQGARRLAAKLPDDLRQQAEGILNGDTMSIRALYESNQNPESQNR